MKFLLSFLLIRKLMLLKIIKSIVRQYAFNRKTLEGFLKYITLRINSENELTLILTFINSFRDTILEENLSLELKKVSISENIIFCYNRTQSEVSAVGEFKVIKGKEYFREKVLETYFDVPFTAFFRCFTGPDLIFETLVFDFCGVQGWSYLSFRLWIGVWITIILLVLVVTDASAYVCYITRYRSYLSLQADLRYLRPCVG